MTGNMMMRTDSIYGHGEAFAYDHLNRLCEAGSDSYAYDTKGNMTHRSGVGDYAYDVARPFAVSQVTFNAMIPQREQFISYNALQQPLATTPSAETERLLQSRPAQYETLANSTKALKMINRGLIGATAITTAVDVGTDIANGKKIKAGARAAVAIATCLSSHIPVVGPFASVGLGITDAMWGDDFYDWVEKEF